MSDFFVNSDYYFLRNVRLDFFDLFDPAKSMEPSKKDNPEHDRYRVRAIFDKESEAYAEAMKGMKDAATKMWGANGVNMLRDGIDRKSLAVRNGNSNLDKNGNMKPDYQGKHYIQCSNKAQPQIVAQARHEGSFVNIGKDGQGYDGKGRVIPASELAFKVTKPYRGCFVDLKVTFVAGKAQRTANGANLPNQIYAQIEAVKFVRGGEAFGRGSTSAEGFEDEEISNESAGSNGDDDDIAF